MPQRRRRDTLNSKRLLRAAVRYPREVAAQLRAVLNAAPKPTKESEKAVCAIVRTATERTLLVSRLVREGRYEDAAVLARTLIELALTGAYLTQPQGLAREHLASRFMGFEPVQVRKYLHRRKVELTTADFPSLAIHMRQVTAVFQDIEEKQNLGWAGLIQDQMVRALRDRDIREGIDNLRKRYGFILSAFVHPTPMGVAVGQDFGSLMVQDIAWCSGSCLMLLCRCLIAIDIDPGDDCFDAFDREVNRFAHEVEREVKEDIVQPVLPLLNWRNARSAKTGGKGPRRPQGRRRPDPRAGGSEKPSGTRPEAVAARATST